MNKIIHRFISFLVAWGLALGASFPALAATFETERRAGRDQAVTLSGNVYYVSPTGQDSNPGSNAAPFRTFAKAVSVLAPGDVLQVMPGTYYEPMVLSKSGTANAPITVIGNGAILNMRGVENSAIRITGNYIYVSGFVVTGATDNGISIPGKYVTVSNNVLYDNVTDNGTGICGAAGSYASALKVGVGGEFITIENNTVYNNCGEGIAVTRGMSVVVRNNTVYDNFAPNIYVDNSPYTRVENNLVYCTGARLRRDGERPTGIGLGEEEYDGWGAQMHDVVVVDNTIRDCGKGIGAFDSEVGGTLTNVTITRNYIPSGNGRAISLTNESNNNVVISYNTLFNEPWLESGAGVAVFGNTIVGTCPGVLSPPIAITPVPSSAPRNWHISNTGGVLYGASGDIPIPADYNRDGLADIAVFRPSNGTWYIYGLGAFPYGASNDIPVPGDYNGDCRDDIAVYRPSNGTWYVGGLGEFRYGAPDDIPVPGDYNGDGIDEFAVFRPSNGTWYVRNVGEFPYGWESDVPVPADYNGDGKIDIAVFRPSNGTWYVYGLGQFLYGAKGDIPVPADYNRDGMTDIAVFRPSNGTWYLRGIGEFPYGGDIDTPVPADYNGDGRADIAVFRP